MDDSNIDAMAMDYDEFGRPRLLIRLKPVVEMVEITINPDTPPS